MTRRELIVVAAVALDVSCGTPPSTPKPVIQFTRVPVADGTGSDKHDIIEGRVTEAHAGQQIVLYAKNGSWWLQPLLETPFTKISPDNKWHNATHLGTEYTALLVDAGYVPSRTLETLPAPGGAVKAVATTKGAAASPSRTINFSGYEWRVRSAPSTRGGRNNPYSAGNAWVDSRGALHLRIKRRGDRLECAEVALTRSLGYGKYSFHVSDVSKLPPHIMFEMFTWDYSSTEQNNREMDVVLRRRVAAQDVSARFVVQPYQVASNTYEFNLPRGAFSHSFRWQPGNVDFQTTSLAGKQVVAQHGFTLGVPSPGLESARMALFLLNAPPEQLAEAEVVIDRFGYTP